MQILSEGQTVRHQQYGLGTVTESNVERTTIDFDNHGVKKFVTFSLGGNTKMKPVPGPSR